LTGISPILRRGVLMYFPNNWNGTFQRKETDMRSIVLAAGTVLVGGVLAFSLVGEQAEASPGKCLRFRDMTNLSKIDNRTAIAHTRTDAKYLVKFRHECRDLGQPGNFYTVRLHSDSECFDRDDVLVFKYGGSCFIEGVNPAPVKAPSQG
jgi:hypothetical protein